MKTTAKKILLKYKMVAVVDYPQVSRMTQWKEEKRKECYFMTNRPFFLLIIMNDC